MISRVRSNCGPTLYTLLRDTLARLAHTLPPPAHASGRRTFNTPNPCEDRAKRRKGLHSSLS